jgi:hypothetical protein
MAVLGASSLQIDSATLGPISGSAPMYAARMWVNFNGTNGSIRANGNLSSATRNGVGLYTFTFTTAMPDALYSVVFGVCAATNASFVGAVLASSQFGPPSSKSTSAVQVAYTDYTAARRDFNEIYASVFR